ncbi:MAG: molybdopterin-dependent oxidoreductase [Georgfuchsia sp.]
MKKPAMNESLSTTKTFCRICIAFCGLDVVKDGNKIVRILPDQSHPYNWRDYCAKGASAHLVRDHPKRLRTPMKRVGDKYIPVSYEVAIKEIAEQLNVIRQKHGANAIGTFIGNPGLSNSPNHVFQGGFSAAIGSANHYNAGSVDQNSFHLVGQEMYGSEIATLIPDVDHAKCFLFLGMNPAISNMAWMDTIPEGWKRVLAAKQKGADLIVVDPRQTPTTLKATTHIVIRPGEDWAFLLGVIKVTFERGWHHQQDCDEANGVDILRNIAESTSLDQLASRCNVSVAQIQDVARRFSTAETAVCVARTGVSQNRNGTLGEWLSHALNLITGRIDRKGGRYYQPGLFKNSMKVANSLGPPVLRRSRIGNYRFVGGGYPLAILPDEILTPGRDQIRALIINSGNPVVSGPDGARLDTALKELDLLIAVDIFQRESHRHAHWLIPGCHFLEREEFLALFSILFETSFAQLGRKAVEPLNGIKPEWEFFRDLAVEMGAPFMGIRGLNSVIRISRWLSRLTGNPHHAFSPRWIWIFLLKMFGVTDWKTVTKDPQGTIYRKEKTYGHFRPTLQTRDGRIHAAPDEFMTVLKQRLAEPLPQLNNTYPFQLVSQRRVSMMNSWLVETTKHPRVYGDVVDINPSDAETRKIEDGQIVALTSEISTIKAKARITDEVPAGILSMDHGWGSRLFDPQGGTEPQVQGVMRNLLVPANIIDELAGTSNLTGIHININIVDD